MADVMVLSGAPFQQVDFLDGLKHDGVGLAGGLCVSHEVGWHVPDNGRVILDGHAEDIYLVQVHFLPQAHGNLQGQPDVTVVHNMSDEIG